MSEKLGHPRGLASTEEKITEKKASITKVIITSLLGIALDEDGNIYATDKDSHHLYKFDKQLAFLKKVGNGKQGLKDNELSFPQGVGIV